MVNQAVVVGVQAVLKLADATSSFTYFMNHKYYLKKIFSLLYEGIFSFSIKAFTKQIISIKINAVF